jgi:general secretion pathway protein M
MKQALLQAFKNLPDSDRQKLKVLALLLGLILLWTFNVAPALKTLREVPQQLDTLDLQTQRLKQMQSQAQTLQKAPRLNATDAVARLTKQSTEVLGAGARINLEGARATLTLTGVPAENLAQFLNLARTQSLALPIEAHLQKAKSKDAQVVWQGTVVLSLPSS